MVLPSSQDLGVHWKHEVYKWHLNTKIWPDKIIQLPLRTPLPHNTVKSPIQYFFLMSMIQEYHWWDRGRGWSSMTILLLLTNNAFTRNLVTTPHISRTSISQATWGSTYQTQTPNTAWHAALRRFDFPTKRIYHSQRTVEIFNFNYNDNTAHVICIEFFLDDKLKPNQNKNPSPTGW